MENANLLLQLDPKDNVRIARRELKKGEILSVSGIRTELPQKVGLGFKVAAKTIAPGDKIIKYGVPIGSATRMIAPGEIVHVHNMKSDFSTTYTIANQDDYEG